MSSWRSMRWSGSWHGRPARSARILERVFSPPDARRASQREREKERERESHRPCKAPRPTMPCMHSFTRPTMQKVRGLLMSVPASRRPKSKAEQPNPSVFRNAWHAPRQPKTERCRDRACPARRVPARRRSSPRRVCAACNHRPPARTTYSRRWHGQQCGRVAEGVVNERVLSPMLLLLSLLAIDSAASRTKLRLAGRRPAAARANRVASICTVARSKTMRFVCSSLEDVHCFYFPLRP
jgi:hypothetical protein